MLNEDRSPRPCEFRMPKKEAQHDPVCVTMKSVCVCHISHQQIAERAISPCIKFKFSHNALPLNGQFLPFIPHI